MTDNDLRDLSIAELKDRREQRKNTPGGTSHIDEELEERRRRREQEAELLDLKTKLEEARRNGLSDDLAIRRVEEQIADLASALDTGPRAELARETGIDRSHVAELSRDEAKDALDKLEGIEYIKSNMSRNSIVSEQSLEDNRAELESVLEGHDASAAALAEGYFSDETGDGLAAALLEDNEEGASNTSERAALGASRTGPAPQEELAEETGLTEAQANQFTNQEARKAVSLYGDVKAYSGISDERVQEKRHKKEEELAELAADVGADKAALGLDSTGV